jgi:hypothetical protein
VCVSLEFQELIISFMIFSCFVSFFPDYFKSRRSTDATPMEKTSAAESQERAISVKVFSRDS